MYVEEERMTNCTKIHTNACRSIERETFLADTVVRTGDVVARGPKGWITRG